MEDTSPKTYVPNHISAAARIFYVCGSTAILAYGAYGLWIDDIFIPGKRRAGLHVHGVAAWLLFAAMALVALTMLSAVADHFDRRDNERNYRLFARITSWAGFGLFLLSLIWFATEKALPAQ